MVVVCRTVPLLMLLCWALLCLGSGVARKFSAFILQIRHGDHVTIALGMLVTAIFDIAAVLSTCT